ncbi:DUF4238 domain-containing protein [Sphingobium sp. AP50]|uniref:DUF4238 domain-containing protein n=1 Tax=Sphingobium sp. AP50 TaxID=1884369 RepID=UPI000B887D45|nr:DUF4238 domain-containing protein [Sphingobium sp. AP50]
MSISTAPKFEKKHHHVVPKLWQKRFADPEEDGPYYLNLMTGQKLPAQGPGDKMSEEYANIVFDEHFRPSDELEDRFSKIEGLVATGLDRLIKTGAMDRDARVDIAMLMAVQACRYPDHFVTRLDLAKILAIALNDYRSCPNEHALNQALQATGVLPGAQLTASEFTLLTSVTGAQLEKETADVLELHGYEVHFNPSLILAAAQPIACHLLGLEWTLLRSQTPSFILSDRPVPDQIGYDFSIGLSAHYGLTLSYPKQPVTDGTIHASPASALQITAINNEVRSRAKKWVCGPTSAVHKMI